MWQHKWHRQRCRTLIIQQEHGRSFPYFDGKYPMTPVYSTHRPPHVRFYGRCQVVTRQQRVVTTLSFSLFFFFLHACDITESLELVAAADLATAVRNVQCAAAVKRANLTIVTSHCLTNWKKYSRLPQFQIPDVCTMGVNAYINRSSCQMFNLFKQRKSHCFPSW